MRSAARSACRLGAPRLEHRAVTERRTSESHRAGATRWRTRPPRREAACCFDPRRHSRFVIIAAEARIANSGGRRSCVRATAARARVPRGPRGVGADLAGGRAPVRPARARRGPTEHLSMPHTRLRRGRPRDPTGVQARRTARRRRDRANSSRSGRPRSRPGASGPTSWGGPRPVAPGRPGRRWSSGGVSTGLCERDRTARPRAGTRSPRRGELDSFRTRSTDEPGACAKHEPRAAPTGARTRPTAPPPGARRSLGLTHTTQSRTNHRCPTDSRPCALCHRPPRWAAGRPRHRIHTRDE